MDHSELAAGGEQAYQQPRCVLLLHGGSLLLHQHRRRNLLVSASAARDVRHEGRLHRAEAWVEGCRLHVGAPVHLPLGVQQGHPRGAAAVRRVGFVRCR